MVFLVRRTEILLLHLHLIIDFDGREVERLCLALAGVLHTRWTQEFLSLTLTLFRHRDPRGIDVNVVEVVSAKSAARFITAYPPTRLASSAPRTTTHPDPTTTTRETIIPPTISALFVMEMINRSSLPSRKRGKNRAFSKGGKDLSVGRGPVCSLVYAYPAETKEDEILR